MMNHFASLWGLILNNTVILRGTKQHLHGYSGIHQTRYTQAHIPQLED